MRKSFIPFNAVSMTQTLMTNEETNRVFEGIFHFFSHVATFTLCISRDRNSSLYIEIVAGNTEIYERIRLNVTLTKGKTNLCSVFESR